MIVRQMHPQELDATMLCFNYYADEAKETVPGFAEAYDEDSMVATVRHYAANYQYIWYNMYEGQRPVGFIGGFMSECPWNNQLVIANLSFVYLLPTHRSMENFKQLYKTFEGWATGINAHQITAGDIGIDVERSKRLYEHLGFKPVLLMVKETPK